MIQKVQLDKLLGNKKIIGILQYFIDNCNHELSQSQLITKLNLSKATAVKWLKYLIKQDLLKCKKIGVTNLHSLNNENIIVQQLKILDILLKLKPIKELNLEIYLYGSAARGEYNENSDIDLLVIGRVKRQEIIGFIDKLSERIRRKISIKIFKASEWSMIRNKDKAYFERVEKDKIKIT